MAQLENMVVIVTGAASGIGKAIATQAVEAGVAKLLLTDIDAASLDRVAATLQGATEVVTRVADLSDPAAPSRVTDAARDQFGRIDGLVNSAGITDRASLLHGTAGDWDRLMAINARAPFLMMQGAVTDMLARSAPGVVVNIQSMNAHCGPPELAIYAASKGALQTLTKNSANAHLSDGIRVNGINLGWTETEAEHDMQANTLGAGADWAARIGTAKPLGRLLQADEAARLAIYLLGPASAPLTGTSIDLEQWVVGAPA